jgi:hypothetical protein
MANKHKNMSKKWHEDWVGSDWNYREKSPGHYAVTQRVRNKQWNKTQLGQEWMHERIWDDI